MNYFIRGKIVGQTLKFVGKNNLSLSFCMMMEVGFEFHMKMTIIFLVFYFLTF